jgi:hypothetical protein
VGLGQSEEVFTVSMNFHKNQETVFSGGDFARGYLDDMLVISFGIWDSSSHLVEVGVEEVLTGHQLCHDLIEEKRLADNQSMASSTE